MMRALIVDDEPSIRFVVRAALTARQWTVDEIDDGSAVEERLEATRYDLLVLDLYMPGMNGFEVLRSLRQPLSGVRPLWRTSPAVPIIALSGAAGGDGLTFAARLGADTCLAKPFDVGELLAAVRACGVG
jgi:DNA-binding response OmpR family regulator